MEKVLFIFIGILEANNMDITNIVLNEFLSVFCYKTKGDFKIDLRGSGCIENNRFFTEDISKQNITVDFLKKQIDKGKYIYIVLNERFIRNSDIKRDNNYYHDWLIYGYNEYKSIFNCVGYSGKDINFRIYQKVEIYYSDVVDSVKNVDDNFFKTRGLNNHLIYLNKNWCEPEISLEKLKEKLNIYLGNKREFFVHKIKQTYNIKAINKFHINFKKQYINSRKKKTIRLINIRIIYEHKSTLLIALKRITNNHFDILDYQQIVDSYYLCLLLATKYNLTLDSSIPIQIYKIMIENSRKEKFIFNKYLH